MTTSIAEANQAVADAAAADAAAGVAAAAVNAVEADLAAGRRGISTDALHEAYDKYRGAKLGAEGARARAERATEAARIAALGEVGRQVDALAAADVADELGEVLQAIADACAKARQLTRAWDDSVRKLIGTAGDLDVGERPPGGPGKRAGYLAVSTHPGNQYIIHHRSRLGLVTTDLSRAIDRAVLGRPQDGLLLLTGVSDAPETERPKNVVMGGGGLFEALYRDLSENEECLVREGSLTVLGADEIEKWFRGELTSDDVRARVKGGRK